MATYSLARFTSPNAGVAVNQAATDQYIAAAYGQALKNLDVNALGLAIANAATSAFTLVLPSGASMTFQAGSTLTLQGVLTAALTAASTLDMSAASDTAGLKLPSKAGAAPTADGFLAFDTTAHTLVIGTNGSTLPLPFTRVTNTLSGDVALNNTANFFDGPSCAQGTSGTWLAMGSIMVTGTSGDHCRAKLWDGTTVIAAADFWLPAGTTAGIHLSGALATPAGNIRISVRDIASATANMSFSATGTGKDCTLTVLRVA